MLEVRAQDPTAPWALPTLQGWSGWPFLVLWSALLLICVASAGGALVDDVRHVAFPVSALQAVGLNSDVESWPTIGAVGPTAERAAIRRGDRLISVDGREAPSDVAAAERAFAGAPGTMVAVVTASPDGRRRSSSLVRDPRSYRAALAAAHLTPEAYLIIRRLVRYAFYDLVMLACAVALLLRRWRERLAPWTSLTLLLNVLGLGRAGVWLSISLCGSSRLYEAFNSFSGAMLLVVLVAFPTGRFEPRWSFAAMVASFVLELALNPSLPGEGSNVLLVVLQAVAIVVIAARYRMMPPGEGRQQIRWAMFGFAAATLALLVGSCFMMSAERAGTVARYDWLSMGAITFFSLSNALLVSFLTISLLRYRLYDADATISRSLVFGAVTLGLLAVFAGSEKLVELLGEQYLGERLGTAAGALAAAAAAVCIVPLHHRTTHWAEKRFRSGLVDLRQGLPLLLADLRETAAPRHLADATLAKIEAGVRASWAAVVVDGEILDARDVDAQTVSSWLTENDLALAEPFGLRIDRSDALFPVRLRLVAAASEVRGAWLLLGPRPDGSFYGREELQALQQVADPVARALAVSMVRERRRVARDAEIETIRDQFESLQRLVAARLGLA